MIDQVLPGLNTEFDQLYIEQLCLSKEMEPWIGGGERSQSSRKLQIWNSVVTGVRCDDKGPAKLNAKELSQFCRGEDFPGEWNYRNVCGEVVNFGKTQQAFRDHKPHGIPRSISRCHETLRTLYENQKRQTEVLNKMAGLREERNKYAGGPATPAKAIEQAARPDCDRWRERQELKRLEQLEKSERGTSVQESP